MYGTVRSNMGKIYGGGGGGGGEIYAVRQGQGPASLHSLSAMPVTYGPQSLSPYINANYANSMGPASLRHHHQYQQQQQQQMQQYNSMQGYYGQESDYESRR